MLEQRPECADAAWTLPQLQDLLDEWVVTWQSRLHEGLRSPYMPSRELTPNEAYAAQVARAGYLPVPLSGEDYIELLPACWRTVNDYGIVIDYRTYDWMAMGCYAAAQQLGRSCPGDIAIIGYNDMPSVEWWRPALITVRIPQYDIGKEAARRPRIDIPAWGGAELWQSIAGGFNGPNQLRRSRHRHGSWPGGGPRGFTDLRHATA